MPETDIFSCVEQGKPIEVFQLNRMFTADTNENKANLGVGGKFYLSIVRPTQIQRSSQSREGRVKIHFLLKDCVTIILHQSVLSFSVKRVMFFSRSHELHSRSSEINSQLFPFNWLEINQWIYCFLSVPFAWWNN